MPSFAARWREYRDSYLHDADEPFNSIAELADHIADRARNGHASELPALFGALELLFHEGDDDLRTLLRIGLLEGLQLKAARHDIPILAFTLHLGPLSGVVA